MMADVGNRLKQAFAGWDAWLLTSDRDLPRQMRLQETRKPVLYNGALECRFFRFEVVKGSYRWRRSGQLTGAARVHVQATSAFSMSGPMSAGAVVGA